MTVHVDRNERVATHGEDNLTRAIRHLCHRGIERIGSWRTRLIHRAWQRNLRKKRTRDECRNANLFHAVREVKSVGVVARQDRASVERIRINDLQAFAERQRGKARAAAERTLADILNAAWN